MRSTKKILLVALMIAVAISMFAVGTSAKAAPLTAGAGTLTVDTPTRGANVGTVNFTITDSAPAPAKSYYYKIDSAAPTVDDLVALDSTWTGPFDLAHFPLDKGAAVNDIIAVASVSAGFPVDYAVSGLLDNTQVKTLATGIAVTVNQAASSGIAVKAVGAGDLYFRIVNSLPLALNKPYIDDDCSILPAGYSSCLSGQFVQNQMASIGQYVQVIGLTADKIVTYGEYGPLTANDIKVLAVSYALDVAYSGNDTIYPLSRNTNGDFQHTSISLTNKTNDDLDVVVRASVTNNTAVKSTDKKAVIFDGTVSKNSTKVIEFYGLLYKEVLAEGNYGIIVDAEKDDTAKSVNNLGVSIAIKAPQYPITSDNVSFSPSTYTPGGSPMTVKVTANDLIKILKTKVTKVSNASDSANAKEDDWKLEDTSPSTATTYQMSNLKASDETKNAWVKVWYPVLTLNATNSKTADDTGDNDTNANTISAKFSVGSKTAGVSLEAKPADSINEVILPETSGKGLYWKVTANKEGIVCVIKLIPVNGTEPVMTWSFTSTSGTLSKEIKDWDCVTATYPKKEVVPVGVYKLVVEGYTQAISNNEVVTTAIETKSEEVKIGKVVNPTGMAFSPAAVDLGKGLTCEAGKILTFTPADTSAQTTNKKVTYSSSAPTIAYVDADTGIITAAAEGEATITATCKVTYPVMTATLKVTVKPAATEMYVNPAQVRALVNGTQQLAVTFNGPAYPVTFVSSDPTVAKVDEKGLVTVLKECFATDNVVITVACPLLPAATEVKVPVIGAVKATGLLNLPGDEVTLRQGIKAKVAGYIQPKNAIENVPGCVTYKSSDESVVFVYPDGAVIGLNAGTAVITLEGAGFTKTITVTVKAAGATTPAE